jgi:carboxyl-terminal processing protease
MTMQKNRTKKYFSLSRFVIALLIFAAGFAFSQAYTVVSVPQEVSAESEDLQLFWQVWNLLEEKYPFEEPSASEKFYGAIAGLARSYGDDYTTFLPPVEAEYFNDTVSGEFGGIGAEVDVSRGLLVIVAPLEDSPAQAAGLKAGDIILKVDDVDVVGMSIDEAVGYIRGEVGTPVTLNILREGQEEAQDITVVRQIVTIPIAETEIIDDTFVLSLFNFNEASREEFRKVIREFKRSGKEKLILDLRNNPGGYLEAAIDITSYFLPQGKVIVTEDFGSSSQDNEVYRSTGHELLEDYDFQMVILVNYGSASASEIVAAALLEHDKATVIGEPSFGKGSVQQLIQLAQDTSLKVTIARWLTPKGNQIDQDGIVPDIIVEEDFETEQDEQLLKALEYLGS